MTLGYFAEGGAVIIVVGLAVLSLIAKDRNPPDD
jgi:hypothetical protein